MVSIDGSHLTLQDIVDVGRNGDKVEITNEAIQAVEISRKWLESILVKGQPVYGINTGFGLFSDKTISAQDVEKLNRNLILSHAVGVGQVLPADVVRAAMLIRANALAKGYSGVGLKIIQTICDMLNAGVSPIVPEQGSLGSSGDLCSLAHLALVFTTDEKDLDVESGWAEYKGHVMTGKAAMSAAGISRLRLGAKEGLALTNGATFSVAIGALAIIDADYLLCVAEAALAMSLEAMQGCSGAFDPRLHEARGLTGQMIVAENVRRLIHGSSLIDSTGRVQDAYSLRCAPQVQGAVRDTVRFVQALIQKEINAATDNPLLFGPNEVISGGNFHGEPIGMSLDYLSIAMAEMAAISERRIYNLTDSKFNGGLPPMLVDTPESAGINSGLMMPQYTAASLTLENKTLATPDSIHSLPTSGGQEDHNANSMTAARHTSQIIENTAQVLAIEIYAAARAIDLRLRASPTLQPGQWTKIIHQRLREVIPYQAGDTLWGPEIQKVKELLQKKELLPPELNKQMQMVY